jgi:hypothetical protein
LGLIVEKNGGIFPPSLFAFKVSNNAKFCGRKILNIAKCCGGKYEMGFFFQVFFTKVSKTKNVSKDK